MGDPAVVRSVPPLRARLNLERRSPLHWLDLERRSPLDWLADPKITMRYAHLSPKAFVEDRRRLSGFLRRAAATVAKIG